MASIFFAIIYASRKYSVHSDTYFALSVLLAWLCSPPETDSACHRRFSFLKNAGSPSPGGGRETIDQGSLQHDLAELALNRFFCSRSRHFDETARRPYGADLLGSRSALQDRSAARKRALSSGRNKSVGRAELG